MKTAIAVSLVRRTIVPILILLSGIGACSDSGPTAPQLDRRTPVLVRAAAAQRVSRPFGGQCETTFVWLSQTVLSISGTCVVEHLGRVTMEATQSVVGQTISNTAVYTAANGDELRTEFAGAITGGDFPIITFDGTETYVGGTGRFDGASGSAVLIGSANVIANTGQYRTSGSITY